jgi:hypothetical protein
MECFYSLDTCGSYIQGRPSSSTGRPPRRHQHENDANKDGKRPTRKSRSSSRHHHTGDDDGRRSRSNSTEKVVNPKGAHKKEPPPRTLRKRIGAAYKRTDDSIVTSNEGATIVTERGLDTINGSEATYHSSDGSGSVSGSSGGGEELTHPSQPSTAGVPENKSAHQNFDMTSVATDNVQDKTSPYSWFQPTLNKRVMRRAASAANPSSPTNSVGAVKNTIKNKFDYIRKNHQFSNFNLTFQDPPSDRSMATSVSINANEAGSFLTRGMISRRNELARQIIKRRQDIVSRAGLDP